MSYIKLKPTSELSKSSYVSVHIQAYILVEQKN